MLGRDGCVSVDADPCLGLAGDAVNAAAGGDALADTGTNGLEPPAMLETQVGLRVLLLKPHTWLYKGQCRIRHWIWRSVRPKHGPTEFPPFAKLPASQKQKCQHNEPFPFKLC